MKDKEQKARRKEFLGRLREYIRIRKNTKFFEEEYYEICENGEVRIRADASEGIFSQYGDKNGKGKKDINEDIAEYIENSAYYIPVARPLKICFLNVKKEEQEAAKNAYRKYFDLKFSDKCLDLKICNLKTLGLLGLGCLFLAISGILAHFNVGGFLHEMAAVIASFTLWESVDFALLEKTRIKSEKLDAAQLLLAEVEFDEGEQENE